MNYPKYDLNVSSESDLYEFYSEGNNGVIRKLIAFSATQYSELYNLAFGDATDSDDVDDTVESKNGDRDKVLATVAASVYEYTSNYPNRNIFFGGSTPSRTRLYKMVITKNYDEIVSDFDIFVLYNDGIEGSLLKREHFNVKAEYKNCVGFIVQRKLQNI
ncbi:DUF6934 family protein [Rurimicrobium arvi]|uniref:Uncharacterized protein n=1 Tax=Rurimicrobium arvi TaxID=2049916 RepID=A0ABP8MFI5_9BACT